VGLIFLLRCNYNPKYIDGLPSFYKDILKFFNELKTLYNYDRGQDMILFNNKEILIGGKPIFIREWLSNNISTEIHLGKAKLRTSISYSTKDSHEVSNWSNKMESNHAAQWRNMEKNIYLPEKYL